MKDIDNLLLEIYKKAPTKKSAFYRGEFYDFCNDNVDNFSKVVCYTITDEMLREQFLRYYQNDLSNLRSKKDVDLIDQCKIRQAKISIEAIRNCNDLDNNIRDIISFVRKAGISIPLEQERACCYLYLQYFNYCDDKDGKYNRDIDNLLSVFSDDSNIVNEIKAYGLVPFTHSSSIVGRNPTRIYIKDINKTFVVANTPDELLKVLCNLYEQKKISNLSFRLKNNLANIHDGLYEKTSLMEEIWYGVPFCRENITIANVTKLCSKDYDNQLWVRIDNGNITFEELCSDDDVYKDAIVTQVIHLQYAKNNDFIVIEHIDHEYIFYGKNDYENRHDNAFMKGKFLKRLKSFKVNNAHIPFDYIVERNVGYHNEAVVERVPFIIFILKNYFHHRDLIDEYFAYINADYGGNRKERN